MRSTSAIQQTGRVRIAVLGSGNVGGTLGALIAGLGHDVHLANRRGPDSMQQQVAQSDNLSADTIEGAVAHGEIVVLAIPLHTYRELPADAFDGKIVIDATNYYPDRDGHDEGLDAGRTTSSQQIAEYVPGATVVKAFNTIHYAQLPTDARPGADPDSRRALPVAGDDESAVARVSELVDQLGFTPVYAGTLAESGRQQPGTPVYNVALTAAELRRALGVG
jgi:predicted dinucleotide-binding enzyme